MQGVFFNLSALLALVPAVIVSTRREPRRDRLFWLVMAVALAGPLAWSVAEMAGSWRTGFSIALWVTVAASLAVFILAAVFAAEAWRLAPLVMLYLLVVAAMAAIWHHTSPPTLSTPAATAWVHAHILVSVAAYALVTVAAVAALGAFLQERALKRKRPTGMTRRLPPLADCESLVLRLLAIGEAVLVVGMVTGMAMQNAETGHLLAFDHKTILVLGAFVVIGGLLIAHRVSGVRGRLAARFVLLAYLLLTLGYPGVKFVTDVLLA